MAGNPIIHSKKLFGGVTTAEQLHAELAWYGKKCNGCGGAPAIRIQIFIRLTDMSPGERSTAELGIATSELKQVKLPSGEAAILYARVFACRLCQPTAERVAARAPSYSIIDIDRGPGPDNAVVQVLA